ncbi:unnamed protein product [Caretta caretta]
MAGAATLFSPELQTKVLGVAKAVSGCLLHLRVCVEGLVVNLINIYALTSGPEWLRFFQQASAFLSFLDPHECLALCGDFNTTLEEQDCSGTKRCLAVADVLREIVKHHSLMDVWRDHHPDDLLTFTFVQHLVIMTAFLSAERLGLAYWHFNNSLLEDVGFVVSFQEFWPAWQGQRHAFPSVQRWWDLGKVCAWLFCCDYTLGASWRRDAAIEQMEQEVLGVVRHLAASPEDPSLCGACWEKLEELQALEDHQAQGAFLRSCIYFLREMDHGFCFFYALEKKRGAKKHITCLLEEDGIHLTDPEEMHRRARAFYVSLFSLNPTDPDA